MLNGYRGKGMIMKGFGRKKKFKGNVGGNLTV
jgi:hypothetical protein